MYRFMYRFMMVQANNKMLAPLAITSNVITCIPGNPIAYLQGPPTHSTLQLAKDISAFHMNKRLSGYQKFYPRAMTAKDRHLYTDAVAHSTFARRTWT